MTTGTQTWNQKNKTTALMRIEEAYQRKRQEKQTKQLGNNLKGYASCGKPQKKEDNKREPQ